MKYLRRRELFGLLAGAPLLGGKKTVVGAHPWVFAAPLPDYDITPVLDRVFEDMRYAGVDAIELMHNCLRTGDAVKRIGELSRKHNLPVLGASYSANMWRAEEHAAILEEAKLLVGRLAKLGGRTLGTSAGNAGRKKTPRELDAQAELLRQIMAMARDNGVVLNLHNHTYEVIDGEHDLRGTLEHIPDAKLGPDIGWLARAGIDPVDFIRRYGNRIVFAHLRDQTKDGKWSEAMGEGAIDFAAVAATLREAKFNGDLVIELAHESGFKPTRPVRDSLKMSRQFVRSRMGF